MSRGMAARLLPAVMAVAAWGAPAGTSAQEWRVDVLGGRDHLQQGPTSAGSSSLLLGLRVLGDERWAGVFGGVPVEEGQVPWGAAMASTRLWTGRGAVRLGADVGGQVFVQADREGVSDDGGLGGLPGGGPPGGRPLLPVQDEDGPPGGWGASAEGMAVLQVRRGRGSFELRGGAAHYRHAFGDVALERTLPQMHAKGSWSPGLDVLLQGEARRYWAEEEALARVDATLVGVTGPTTLWLSAGQWVEGSVQGTPWAAGVSVEVHRRALLTASVRREPYDPLYLTPDRTTWSAGVSLRFGRPDAVRAPVPDRYEAGVATVTLPAGDVEGTPRIAGDFNEWQPAPMVREGGRWIYRVRVEPGVYNYAFVTADGDWFVPESVPGRKPDGFGGHVAVLVVSEGS